MKCLECGDRTSKKNLRVDPRDPPLDTEPAICVTCYISALEDMIEEMIQLAKELQKMHDDEEAALAKGKAR